MAAPIDARFNSHPKWINPCGLGLNPGQIEIDSEIGSDYYNTGPELFERIIVTARNALMHAQRFKEDYVRKTFNQEFSEFHDLWKNRHYDWLPGTEDIPKVLGEATPQDHLGNLKLDMTLKNVYQFLQKYAVGLEQVVWDQGEDSGFKKDFEDAEFKLRATLCEVQVAMIDSNVNQPTDITRDVMTEEYRVMKDVSVRNLRDWLIFRDYMNGLEYVIQVFEHFKTNESRPS